MTDRQPETIDVTTHLLVQPEWRDRYWKDAQGRPILQGGKVVKATQGRPSVPREGVAVKVTLRIPASAFLPLMPEAVIIVGADDVETITVEASDPRADDE